jgi:hypothetical protein
MNTLTKAEKIQIIESHKKNLDYNRYNLEISVIQENAKSNPDSLTIADLSAKIDDQLAALDTEIATVNALAE